MATRSELESMFQPKQRDLKPSEVQQVERIKRKALDLAIELNPTDTREKSLAMTKLQEAVHWAIEGITK